MNVTRGASIISAQDFQTIRSPASGSAPSGRLGVVPIRVTPEPNRRNTWDSSSSMATPPSSSSDFEACSVRSAPRLTQNRMPARHGRIACLLGRRPD